MSTIIRQRQYDRMQEVLDLRGLDLVTPTDLLANGHTPFSKNFRLYAQQADDRRVAVSSRKGPGYYTVPLSEALYQSNTSSTGSGVAKVGVITGVHMIPFTATDSSRLTRVDLNVSDSEQASGPLMVQIYSDSSGQPGRLLSESSILSGAIGSTAAWLTARFINSVQLENTVNYWIVIRVQDDGKRNYNLASTTDGTLAYLTDSAMSQGVEQAYSLNYKIYTTPDAQDKGGYRFARDNGQNVTVAAYGTTLYMVDETSGVLVPIITGLSSSASEYRFTNGDNRVFWVNSYDQLTSWTGIHESVAPNLVTNGAFETNTIGWLPYSGNTLTRITTAFHTGAASMYVNAPTARAADYAMALKKNVKYKIEFYAKPDANSTVYIEANSATIVTPVMSQACTSGTWTKFSTYFTPTEDKTYIRIADSTQNFCVDDVSIVSTGVETILDPELPILSDILMHKDRLFGVVAADPNKLVFSENPGNPAYDSTGTIPTTAREQWYYAWLSVSFWYVPRPHNGSPITKIISFQDALTISTQDNKYVLSGYDRGSFYLRQSNGNKGAISNRGVASDENSIYFVGSDGFYVHNGSSDEKISGPIAPLFDACPLKNMITPVLWKNQVRFYMASELSTVNDICAIYDKDMKEWMLDTDTYVNRALAYGDANDDSQLVEFSSHTATAFLAEQGYNSLGAPIDFEYRLKYDSMGTPMQRKRLKRFWPILQGVDSTFNIQLAMDKNFEDSPKIKEQLLTTNGTLIGDFILGDGTLLGGSKSFKPKRQSYSGYANYWQLRVMRKAVNNRVAFIGAQFSYKTKRL